MEGSSKQMTTVVQTPQNLLSKLSDYCKKNFQCFVEKPGLFWLRKIGRFELIRNAISLLFQRAENTYQLTQAQPTVFQNVDVDAVVSGIKTDSYGVGVNLPPSVVKEIRDFADSTLCFANRDSKLGFYYREKEKAQAELGQQIRLGSYLHNLKKCEAVKRLETDPTLLAIAAKFLGAPPVHMATELWWSFPVEASQDEQLKAAQVYHYDLDDYRFIKFFFYLTDVDLSAGPHILIRGTHKNKTFFHQLLGLRCASKDDQEIVSCYGADKVVTICGEAGLGFAEDSTCFHKGTLPTSKERLLLQIEYSINSYGEIRELD
jgi:hypothetical protein